MSAKNVTLGVPRLKEILDVSKTPKTPRLTVYLQDHVSNDQDIAKFVHSMLEYTVLGDIAILTEIHYDPNVRISVVPKDAEFVQDYYELSEESEAYLCRLSRFVLRIEVDQYLCQDKNIKMNDIVQEIQEVYGEDLNVIVTDDNAENLVLRIRIVDDASSDEQIDGEINQIEKRKSLFEEDWYLLKQLEKVCYESQMVVLHVFHI